jgi:hypothetical protein
MVTVFGKYFDEIGRLEKVIVRIGDAVEATEVGFLGTR